MSNDNWEGTGYDAAVSDGQGGKFFRLKKKGEEARVRLCTAAYRYMDTLKGQNGEPDKTLRKAAWGAILKEVGPDGKPNRRAVVFQGGAMIYGLVKDLADSEDWGDPTTYDLKVTRTEEQGKYYTVLPIPNRDQKNAIISDADKDLLKEIGITSVADLKGVLTGGASQHKDTEEYDVFADE